MKHSARLAELVAELRLNPNFQEFWKLIEAHNEDLVKDAIFSEAGDPAEKRGAAKAVGRIVNAVNASVQKEKTNSNR